MAATTQAERRLARGELTARVSPLRVVVPERRDVPRGRELRALARDAAGGLLVVGSAAALWAWFLAATL